MSPNDVLSALPNELRDGLLVCFAEIQRNYAERRWEPSELNGGKFSEAVFRILEWHTSGGSYTALGKHIRDFGTAVRKFESFSSSPDSIRFHIPNALRFLYTVRNKRGVGHLGGDVDPNHMDAEAVEALARWTIAELVRIFHTVTTEAAQAIVEGLVEKRVPLVWTVAGRQRILDPQMDYLPKTLVVLYSMYPQPARDTDLFEWTEYSRIDNYRVRILAKGHEEKFLEFDRKTGMVHLSPLGARAVEELIRQRESVLS